MTAATTITETASALADITVYAGPGESAYAAIGSISLTESFLSINDELGFRYIEYDVTGSTKKKRGYIVDVLAANTYPGDFAAGRKGTAKSGITVYTGPSSANYVTAGSLSGGESFTYLTYNPTAAMQFIEYSTASGTKRGYIFTSDATAEANTALAKANGNITTYATPGGAASGSLQGGGILCDSRQDHIFLPGGIQHQKRAENCLRQ